MTDTLDVEGVTELLRAIERLRADLPHAVQVAMGDVAETVVAKAQPRVPVLSGAARRSVRVDKAGPVATVHAGGSSAPYFGWLDFGGHVGRRGAIRRPYVPGGRYVLHEFVGLRDEPAQILARAIADASRGAGLEMS